MSEVTYEFMRCDTCGLETRKDEHSGPLSHDLLAPPGWSKVSEIQTRKSYLDMCPICHKAFMGWAAQHLLESTTPKREKIPGFGCYVCVRCGNKSDAPCRCIP